MKWLLIFGLHFWRLKLSYTCIHTLDMTGCYQITDNAICYLTGIHTLNVTDCHWITDNEFRHLTGIHTLNMTGWKNITDNAFRHFGIHTLKITGCIQVTDNAFIHLTGIHTLDMNSCKNVTDKAFSYLAGIHTLDISGCDHESITEKTLSYLKGLRSLTWYATNQRDKSFIKKVVDYCESNSITHHGLVLRLQVGKKRTPTRTAKIHTLYWWWMDWGDFLQLAKVDHASSEKWWGPNDQYQFSIADSCALIDWK